MAHKVSHIYGKRVIQGVCGLALAACLGCARHEPAPVAPLPAPAPAAAPAPAPETPAPAAERLTSYDLGVRAYDAGEFKRAATLWREAATNDPDQAVRRRAMFALAAVKLTQAGSDSELSTAQDLLDAWAKSSPPGGSGEDPRFLLPAFKTFKPAFAVKEMRATLERECAKKLSEREEQVKKSLQQQVKALESIHQQIQEKKKGLTNY
uniref:Tetratricopeptide repeat protein n=1 Tax=Desulfovibrio sp. U5L TaxID=596152 RepID=I2Q379_9BACT